MSRPKFMNLFKVAPVLLGASFVAAQAQPVFAQSVESSEQELLQQIDEYNNQGNSNSLNQVNSVFQLRDVSPGDWAFEALRNLVERYGCIAGYPDGTYRGNRALTRYEFAAGLNACLQQLERIIGSGVSDIEAEDLAIIQRLVQEFEAELATLGTRVDNLEGRVGFLEDNQFSTTTKLGGSVVFLNAVAFGGDDGNLGEPDGGIGFVYDAVLDFKASFTGRDQLKVSFQAANFGDPEFTTAATGTTDAALDNDEDTTVEDTGGVFQMEDLIYSFPIGDNVQVAIGANDFDPDATFDYSYGSGATLSDYTIDGEEAITDGTGAEDDVGISANFAFNENVSFGVGYTTDDGNANDPEVGLFANYSLSAGLNFSNDTLDLGIGYNLTQTSGDNTIIADDIDNLLAANNVNATAGDFTDTHQNSIGARGAVRLGSRVEIGAFVEYIDIKFKDPRNRGVGGELQTDGWDFGANIAFFDIGKEGSTLGIAFGSRALFDDIDESIDRVTISNDFQEDRTWIVEASYDFPINDNISITPGLIAIFNPERNSNNSDIFIGVLRTSFSF